MTIVTATVIAASITPAIDTSTAIGHATARNANDTTSDTCRANPSACTGTATTVSERVIRNEGHPHKQGGCETYKDTTHHCLMSLPTIVVSRDRARKLDPAQADF